MHKTDFQAPREGGSSWLNDLYRLQQVGVGELNWKRVESKASFTFLPKTRRRIEELVKDVVVNAVTEDQQSKLLDYLRTAKGRNFVKRLLFAMEALRDLDLAPGSDFLMWGADLHATGQLFDETPSADHPKVRAQKFRSRVLQAAQTIAHLAITAKTHASHVKRGSHGYPLLRRLVFGLCSAYWEAGGERAYSTVDSHWEKRKEVPGRITGKVIDWVLEVVSQMQTYHRKLLADILPADRTTVSIYVRDSRRAYLRSLGSREKNR